MFMYVNLEVKQNAYFDINPAFNISKQIPLSTASTELINNEIENALFYD